MAGESSTSAPSLSLPSPTDVPPLLPPAGMPPPPQRGHGGRRASSSLPAAEAASERLGGAASMPGPPVARERYMRWEWRVPSRALALSTI